MNCKHAPELVLAAINDGTYDPAEGCRWPRDVIAAYTGLCEKTVSRATTQLEAQGRLKVHRPRKRGECNTYFVGVWNPPLRKRTIARLAESKPVALRLREAKCPPNRTAGLCRAQNAVAGPTARALTPRCTQLKDQRSGREARIDFRRSSRMDQSRRSHIQAVPDLTSQPLLEELERKDDIIRKLQLELNKSMENEAGALAAAKAAGNALNAAKGQLTKDQKKSAKAGQVQQVVDHWRLLRPRTGPEFGEPGSKSFAVIEKALVLMANDPSGAVAACCEAIDGLHMAPWWSYGKRYATPGEGRVLKRDLEHALGDEQRIVKCRGIVRWMRAGGVERTWEVYRAVQETESVLRAEVLDLLGEQRFRREEPAEWCFVDGARTRLDEK